MRRCVRFALLLLAAGALSTAQDGPRIYQEHCAQCHESGAVRIPPQTALRQHTSAAIARILEVGVMKQQAAGLSPAERQAVAQWLGGSTPVSLDASHLTNACKAAAPAPTGKPPAWTSWGGGLENGRFQSSESAGLTAAEVPRLKLKWAFAAPNATTLRSQPALYGRRIFFAAETTLYSLDAASGCVYWTTELTAPVRSGISFASLAGNPTIFFGDEGGQIQAFDANTGKLLWQQRADAHPAALVTAAPVFYQDRLYVSVASAEEAFATSPGYVCCTFRGSVLALNAASGSVLWKTYTIDGAAQPGPILKSGAKSMGPSGAGVWSSPTLDPQAGVLYITTGDNYSAPATKTSDSVMALALDTGKIQWTKQMRQADSFNVSCFIPGQANCPDSPGPDFDFGSPSVLIQRANGTRLLVLAQKSGAVFAVDPDHQGRLVWQSQAGKGGVLGGIEWGVASDGNRVYAALSDLAFLPPKSPGQEAELDPTLGGGMFAFQADNGERLWMTPPPGCGTRRPCSPAQSSAVSAIPGAVFSGSIDGHIRAYATTNGKIIWDYDTQQEYQAINGIKGQGGSLNAGGPIIAGGRVFVNSGYSQFGEVPGNVLLAFTIDGR